MENSEFSLRLDFLSLGGMSMDATSVVTTDVGYYLLLFLLFTIKQAKLYVLNTIVLYNYDKST